MERSRLVTVLGLCKQFEILEGVSTITQNEERILRAACRFCFACIEQMFQAPGSLGARRLMAYVTTDT